MRISDFNSEEYNDECNEVKPIMHVDVVFDGNDALSDENDTHFGENDPHFNDDESFDAIEPQVNFIKNICVGESFNYLFIFFFLFLFRQKRRRKNIQKRKKIQSRKR